MKWWWNGGVERKAKLLGECWTFFNLHFPAPAMEAMSRICACKTERNLQIFGWCSQFKQSCPWATLSYFCLQEQGRKINAMRRVVLENVLKRAQRYHSHGMRRSLFANWIYYIAARNHDLFVKTGTKREWEKKELRPQASNAQYNTQGWDVGGGWSEKTVGGRGGGGRLLYANLYMSRVKWYDNTHNFSILLKRDFYLQRFKSEGQQKPGDVTLMQSDCKWLPRMLL
jgi:hypothetical protein